MIPMRFLVANRLLHWAGLAALGAAGLAFLTELLVLAAASGG
ncbi:hypothetical protein [Cyanobium sp. PCC 7001]|jgi:hypothetical protein|nr:hypothetical protein [Cyanobium sp. PCC 7001]